MSFRALLVNGLKTKGHILQPLSQRNSAYWHLQENKRCFLQLQYKLSWIYLCTLKTRKHWIYISFMIHVFFILTPIFHHHLILLSLASFLNFWILFPHLFKCTQVHAVSWNPHMRGNRKMFVSFWIWITLPDMSHYN